MGVPLEKEEASEGNLSFCPFYRADSVFTHKLQNHIVFRAAVKISSGYDLGPAAVRNEHGDMILCIVWHDNLPESIREYVPYVANCVDYIPHSLFSQVIILAY